MTDEDDLVAAEFALGLLNEAEALAVQARARTEAPLSLRIAWWRDQFAPLATEAETPPPADLWPRIAMRLPGNDTGSENRLKHWRAAAVTAMAVAAALLVFIAVRPPATPVTQQPAAAPMIAALAGEGGSVVAVSYDAESGRLMVAPTSLDPGKGDAELWIIPAGGTPRSLGVVNAHRAEPHQVAASARPDILPGATFAITQEVAGGSPTGKPGGPIIASGKIIRT